MSVALAQEAPGRRAAEVGLAERGVDADKRELRGRVRGAQPGEQDRDDGGVLAPRQRTLTLGEAARACLVETGAGPPRGDREQRGGVDPAIAAPGAVDDLAPLALLA